MSDKTAQQPHSQSFWKVFVLAFRTLSQKDPLRLGAATAFFSIFALPPILIILINALGIIFNEDIISGQLFNQMREVVGEEAMEQIHFIFRNFQNLAQNWFFTLVGTIFLIFVSTTLFVVVQRSINEIWNIQQKPNHRVRAQLRQRLTSLLVILLSGLLVVVALLSETVLAVAGHLLARLVSNLDVLLVQIANQIFSIVIITVWFALLFRYLPDGRVAWKAIWVSALLTSLLFAVGKFVLGKLLVNSNLTSIYGAAGSIVLLLLFIFYASFILYYGAAFTRAYADYAGIVIHPKRHATTYEIKTVEKG